MSNAKRSSMQGRSLTRQVGLGIALCVGLGASLELVLWLARGHAGHSAKPGAAVASGADETAPSEGASPPLLASAVRLAKPAPKEVVHDGPAGIRYVGKPESFVSADGVSGHAYKLPAGYVPRVEVDEAAPPAEEMAAPPAVGEQRFNGELDGPALPEDAQPVDFAAHGYESLLEMEDAYRKQLKLGDHIEIRFYERTAADVKTSLGFQIFPRTPDNIEAPAWMPPPPALGEASGFVPPPLPER